MTRRAGLAGRGFIGAEGVDLRAIKAAGLTFQRWIARQGGQAAIGNHVVKRCAADLQECNGFL